MRDKIYAQLSTIVDPEVGFDIVSLGLIYDVSVSDDKAKVTMTLSTKSCPLHELILGWVKDAALRVDGINECEIDLVWEPEWNITMASDEVKKALGA
ncbi:Fe-S protein maturation auxiliary factor SufT [Campylobacter majalis]|uniref:Fe-S protein maturation auxiliary factor SufT n=1 Tax=Campylobacter majalis TaxID=2790656 RepID=A0ABM8Q3W0_9BACT|nr:metal-sulfur cluster assembly factor [Campylobacter majalis]CAD7287410.1 Fe-S protein maturation auxiliary factor SufT [Campylobacter majalis]